MVGRVYQTQSNYLHFQGMWKIVGIFSLLVAQMETLHTHKVEIYHSLKGKIVCTIIVIDIILYTC